MFKKIFLFMMVFSVVAVQANAQGMVVGTRKIIAVEKSSYVDNKEKGITLIKPVISPDVQLVSLDDFLKVQSHNSIIISEEEYVAPEEDIVEDEVAEVVQEEVVAKEKPAIVDAVLASEVYVAYSSDKKTLLSSEAKKSLLEIANKAKEDEATIGIITYAAGEPSMARRVALLRANIIQNTLKGYGVSEGQIDLKSFGNQININQSKVFLLK
jgi:outer membrane protein OmpA-like peptidoglycan-associated protein